MVQYARRSLITLAEAGGDRYSEARSKADGCMFKQLRTKVVDNLAARLCWVALSTDRSDRLNTEAEI